MAADAEMVVVCQPGSTDQMDRYVSALSAVGLHPITAYRAPKSGVFQDTPSNYPVLIPKTELKQAQAIIRAIDGGVPAKDQYEPPVPTQEQAKRALGAIAVLMGLVVGVTLLVLAVQFLIGLARHGP